LRHVVEDTPAKHRIRENLKKHARASEPMRGRHLIVFNLQTRVFTALLWNKRCSWWTL